MEEVGENMPSLAIEDDWIDDMEAPIIHHCNELIHIVNQYRHEATEHKCLPSFDGNRQHYETFRNAWLRYERNWRKFLLQEIRIHPNATDEDKIEAMSMIYEHMMEHLEHHLEGDALPFFTVFIELEEQFSGLRSTNVSCKPLMKLLLAIDVCV
jgi:hypothetical protein